jgi:Kdo2-lipid IVA lauroyltransferase/acyltransferase
MTLASGWLHWLARRPLRHLHALGGVLGWTVWAASPSYRRRLVANAALAGVAAPARRRAVAEAGRMTLELPRLWLRARSEPIADPVHWHGAELIEQALAARRGLVLITPHMGSFEVCAQAYAERFGARQPITVLYRPARKAWLRELEETARARDFLATAPATLGGVRQLMRALKNGQTIGLLPDQVPPEGMGVWAPFFGQPAYTMTLAAKLVRQSRATVLAMWCERLPRGAGYRLHVLPMPAPLPVPAPADEAAALVADASAINRSMELVIARGPAQYLWGYHRYKQPRQENAA